MSQTSQIQLKTSCVMGIPLQVYHKDFSFIVNGKEFKISKVVSDLLSPIISRIHSNDPTFDTFIINTQQQGDFSHVLNLFNFKRNNIPDDQLPFIRELIEILGIDSIEYQDENETTELTVDNVFTLIKKHEKHSKFYHNRFSAEIAFIASHFSELCNEHQEDLEELSIDTLMMILSDECLQLESEDQIVRFVNFLYGKNVKYSILYETVLFENVTSGAMKEFTSVFNSDDMTSPMWMKIVKRLESDVEGGGRFDGEVKRYKKVKPRGADFGWTGDNEFKGIINHLRQASNNQIDNEVSITASSIYSSSECFQPHNVALFENQGYYFQSQNVAGGWLCFDFKERRVAATAYTVRSYQGGVNYHHPKSWVIEGSNDNSLWATLDKQDDCPHLNGYNYAHTFIMNQQNTNEYKYIRMRLTGPNWNGHNYLMVDSFEIYGTLI